MKGTFHMTEYQRDRCATIIKNASDAALVAGGINPAATMPVQANMVMDIASVFNVSISSSTAASIAKSYFTSGSLFFTAVSAASWLFPPAKLVTTVIDGFKAAEKTEDFGWKVARDFDNGKY